MTDFSSDVSQWCDQATDRASALFCTIVADAVARVQELTPVDTGFLRSNWTVVKPGDAEPVAGRVPNPQNAIIQSEVGDVLMIVNPTVYARRIEFGYTGEDSLGRYFNQPGRHMMQQTISEMPQIAQRALARVSTGGTR